MSDSPATRASLLVRLRDARDAHAWSQFVDVYAPLIYGFARKQGLQDADAADLVQDVLRSVAGAIGRLDYDSRLGSFRGWLFTIARNRLRDTFARGAAALEATGGTGMQQILLEQPAPDEEAAWNADYERRVFGWAAEQVRRDVHDTTWEAFHQTAVEGRSGPEVAANLGLTVAAVYLAKSRVMARLKEKIAMLREDEND
jgi:RNA polymerase sigma-70 factor (ECF subfamily)